jgi:tRNA threonylcarbamoyladenosine biosynthesis protein TsaE
MLLASADETEAIGRALAASLRAGDAVALYGDLGAGKTTFARGLLRGLGFEGDVASPTFSIMQLYDEIDPPVWHVDLYRIENRAELGELALDDAREGAILLVEWPERLGEALWPDALRLRFAIAPANARSLTANVPPAWEGRWPPR